MTGKGATASIRSRLLLATLLILPLFLGLTLWGLDRAFATYQLDAQRERMRLQQLLLAKAADWDGSRWQVTGLDEPALGLLNSGLYAFLLSRDGEVLWHSPSAEQIGELVQPVVSVREMVLLQELATIAVGENRFGDCAVGGDHFCYTTGVAWGSSGPEGVFLILEHQRAVTSARDAYRGSLIGLAVTVALLLLLAQAWIIRWGLLPLVRIASDIGLLEQGKLDRLHNEVPLELLPLTDGVNQLLGSERSRRERVRNTMDRLAHVLKTPLMLLRNSREEGDTYRQLVQEQVSRMLGIVEGELARARLDGRAPDILGQAVPVQPVLQRIVDAYRRLPRLQGQGELTVHTGAVAADVAFAGEERDLQDLFGSILENSLKYCRGQVDVAASLVAEQEGDWLEITVGDDGEGIPQGLENEILRRGARADTANVGQGLGLSIVVEIVSAYGGSLHTDKSPLGGALFTVRLPGTRLSL